MEACRRRRARTGASRRRGGSPPWRSSGSPASLAAAGSIVIRWWPRCSNRNPASSADGLGPGAPALEAAAEVDVDPGMPVHRVVLLVVLDAPATCPPTSTTSSTDESSPRSSSSITSTGSGSPHQRATDGSARIARSFGASPGRPGRSLTRQPVSVGHVSGAPPSPVIGGSVPRSPCLDGRHAAATTLNGPGTVVRRTDAPRT